MIHMPQRLQKQNTEKRVGVKTYFLFNQCLYVFPAPNKGSQLITPSDFHWAFQGGAGLQGCEGVWYPRAKDTCGMDIEKIFFTLELDLTR